MNSTSAKSLRTLTLISGLLLALQHVNAFPHGIKTSAEEEETAASVVEFKPSNLVNSLSKVTKATDIEIANTTEVENEESSETDSSEEFFYLPEVYNTPTYRLQIRYFRLTQAYVNKLLTEGRDFLENVLKAMNALPHKTAGIEAYITRISDILKRIKNQDLTKNDAKTEKDDIIYDFTELYGDFETVLNNDMPKDEADLLTEVFEKYDLVGYNERLDVFLKDTANKITKVANKFFNKLNEEEKQKYAELIKWYEDFKQSKTDLDKYNDAVSLIQYLLTHRF
ncbi:uncharacterized protein LOC105212062 [Zeugodacus cucurbitae]|uniref:uncharacterized protein LOC105212062 n=1 Tax=Zeugodacus cucurbitae TaxID=28588 RepID=UPI0023D9531D|nr:uncharacterized protein LOC105212062 [Zeugodacus cucurbitae]